MTQRIQHRRFADPAANWPAAAVMAGEVVVNPVRHALGIGDIDGTVRSICDVRPFDDRSQYLVGDMVTQAGTIYRCKTAIGVPHAFLSTEWDPVGQSASEMYPTFDLRYALIDHNHDADYAAIDHLHEGVYAPVAHTHPEYALASHNHDGTYAKLEGGNSISGTNNFTDIVNFIGSYVAVFGALSVGGGTGFVPSSTLHVRQATGIVAGVIEAASANQARLVLKNTNREYMLVNENSGSEIYLWDQSGGQKLQTWAAINPGTGLSASAIVGSLSVYAGLNVWNATPGGFAFQISRKTVGGVSADFYQGGGGGYVAFQSLAGPDYICDISPGGFGGGLPAPVLTPGTAGLRIKPGEMMWNPVGHTFLRDGILCFRAFPDAALPSFAAYPGAIVFSSTVPGRMWMTNDGLSWKRQDFS